MKKLFVAIFLFLSSTIYLSAQDGAEKRISEEKFLELSEHFVSAADGSGVMYLGEIRSMTYSVIDGTVFTVNFTKDFKTRSAAKSDYSSALSYYRSFMTSELQVEDEVWFIIFDNYGVYVKLINKKRVVFEFCPIK